MISRRTVLKSSVAAALAAPIITVADDRTLRVTATEADGTPVGKDRLKGLVVRDMAGDPLPVKISGTNVTLGSEPIQLTMSLKVPGFGEVYCFADNGGKGYSAGGEVDFVADAAATRLRRVQNEMVRFPPADPVAEMHLVAATDAKKAYESLAHGLHAGEHFVLNLARQRISRFAKPRKEFLFSVLANRAPEGGAFAERVKELFNFAPTSWYSWKDEEPAAARIDYARMDNTVNWLLQNHMQAKIFGYCYMTRGATPTWIRPDETPVKGGGGDPDAGEFVKRSFNPRWPYDRVRAEYQRVVKQTVERYKGRAQYVEVINEAHDKANLWGLNHEQIVEMTKLTCEAAGGTGIKRLINDCCLWAEYAKRPNPDGSRRWSPYRYLRDCMAAGVEFEVVGVQLYYPQFDLFEIDRMLDRMATLGKPVHVTEMSTASTDGLDPQSMRPRTAAPGWHGPWTEAMQADWTEGIYTLIYSKPEYEAAGWWDLADTPGHFWPFGGLLHADMTPKESYRRIAKLQKDWGLRKD